MKIKFQGIKQVAILGMVILLALSGRAYLLEGGEVLAAETAREMLETGNFIRPQFNFLPAWAQLPLYAWLQAFCLQVFGTGTFAVRLPNAISGILTIFLLFRLGTLLYNPRFGLIWSAAFISGLLPLFYLSTGIEAPWSSLLLFTSLVYLILFYWKNGQSILLLNWPTSRYLYLGGLLAGFASLMRGPEVIILLAAVLGVYWLYKNLRFYISVQQFFLFFSLALLVPLIWLSVDGVLHGPDAALAIPLRQWQLFAVAPEGEQKIWFFYFALFLLGYFPASIFALQALLVRSEYSGDIEDETVEQNDFRRWMKMFLWTALIFYTLRSAKAPHYAFPVIFPVSYLAAWTIHRILIGRLILDRWLFFALGGVGILILGVTALQAWPALLSGIPGIWMPEIPEGIESGRFYPPYLLLVFVLGIPGFLAWKKLRSGLWWAGIRMIFIAATAFSLSEIIFFLPPATVKAYGPVVEFARSKAGEDCYVYPYKFEHYGTLFYAGKKGNAHPRSGEQDWLLFGEADKPVYYIARTRDAAELSGYTHIEELYKRGGYVFFMRVR
jgi:4-amino-4-deoxy-L-arabinose transferase-like glycosyltransferase